MTATIADPDQGVSEDLDQEDRRADLVGPQAHENVKDEAVGRIVHRVKEEGMGFSVCIRRISPKR